MKNGNNPTANFLVDFPAKNKIKKIDTINKCSGRNPTKTVVIAINIIAITTTVKISFLEGREFNIFINLQIHYFTTMS